MKRTLRFQSTCIDVKTVGSLSAGGSIEFMTGELPEGEAAGPSVSAVDEAGLLRWVFSRHPSPRQLICHHLGMPLASEHRFSVTSPVLPLGCTKPGDVDWICADPAHPQLAVAAECKRVKVVACRDGSDHINKIKSLGDGVRQANALAEHGFHRTFLAILIVVDGRDRTQNNVVSRGMTDSTFRSIYDFPHRESLSDEVGVVYIEVVQPSLRHVDSMVQIGVCVDRPAKPRDQTASMTKRIRDLFTRMR